MVKLFNKLFLFLYGTLLFITPLIMYHKTSELFEFNKMLFIYLITFLIISIWVSKMIFYKKIIIKKTAFDIPILLFLISQILSTILSIDRHTSIFGYYGRFNGGLLSITSYIILYYAFVSNFAGRDMPWHVSTLLKTSLISSTVVILWGLPGRFGYDLTCYLFTGVLNNSCWTEQFKPQERMFSTLGQPNWLGAYLAINFFIGLYFLLKQTIRESNNWKFFIFYFLYLILNISAILFTRSRSAFLSVGFGLFLFLIILFYYLRDDRIRCGKFSLKKVFSLFFVLLIPIFVFKTGFPKIDRFLYPGSYLNKFPISNNQLPVSPSDITESGDIRKIVWRGAVNLGLKYPFFGTGVETFAYSYYFVRPKEHNLTSEWDFIYNKAHNEYLNYLATTGFFGLGTYLVMMSFVLFILIKKISNIKYQISNIHIKYQKYKNNEIKEQGSAQITNYQLLITCLLLAYLTTLITNFFGFSTTTINLYFYLIPAFLITMTDLKQFSNLTIKQLPSLSLSQKFLFIVPIIICLAGFIFPVSYFLADTNYALADNYQKIQDYPQAYIYLNKALLFKDEHVYEDKLSNVLANLAFIAHYEKSKDIDIKQLIKLSDFYNLKSIKASPKNVLYWKTRAKIFYLFYQIKGDQNNLKKAIDALETAKIFSPTDPKIYYSQAMLYLNNNQDKALTTINKSLELKSNYRDGYYAKGLILKQLGKKEQARKVFQYILEKLNPNDEEIKKELSL